METKINIRQKYVTRNLWLPMKKRKNNSANSSVNSFCMDIVSGMKIMIESKQNLLWVLWHDWLHAMVAKHEEHEEFARQKSLSLCEKNIPNYNEVIAS